MAAFFAGAALCTPPFCWRVEPPTNFQNGGGAVLDRRRIGGKEEGDLFEVTVSSEIQENRNGRK